MISRRNYHFMTLGLALVGAAHAEFSLCKFNFGVDFQQHSKKACGYVGCSQDNAELKIPADVDFLAMFVGKKQVGATNYAPGPTAGREGIHLMFCKSMSLTPVWYTYIIAEGAKFSLGVGDCNAPTGAGTLCQKGAGYIRSNRAAILSQYKAYAQYIATGGGVAKYAWGTTKPAIFAIEPDFYQYTASTQANPLSFQEANQLLKDIAATIKAELPNVYVSMDISPWASGSWFSSGIPYSEFKLMNTSGGISGSGSTIKDGLTWASMWNYSKKGMIADDGYGVSGELTSPNSGWVNSGNVNSRIAEGVVGLMEAYGDANWVSQVKSLRSSLKELKTCADQPATTAQFTLTLQAGAGGSIQANPSQAKYDSAASIVLTAIPQSKYKFVSWGGDLSGNSTPSTFVIKKNANISATFEAIPVKKYNLRIDQPTAGGTISVSPNQTSFDSLSTVVVTANPTQGWKFSSWSGFTTAKGNPLSFVMDADKSIGVVFQSTSILPRLGHLPVQLRQTPSGLAVHLPSTTIGLLQTKIIGLDGRMEALFQSSEVGSGSFDATYSLDGLRPGLHMVHVVNVDREYRSTITVVR